MDFKQAIIENAWGGISVDYGMLHFQLATPALVVIIILFMIFALNKLFFQPVIRTLDNRKEIISKSQKRVIQVEVEVEHLKKDFQHKLNEVKAEVLNIRNLGREKGMASREAMIIEERKTLQKEFENNFDRLSKEIKTTKSSFSILNKELSFSISKQLLG